MTEIHMLIGTLFDAMLIDACYEKNYFLISLWTILSIGNILIT